MFTYIKVVVRHERSCFRATHTSHCCSEELMRFLQQLWVGVDGKTRASYEKHAIDFD